MRVFGQIQDSFQGNSKYCSQHGDLNCENYYLFGPICTNTKFYKKLIPKKHKVSCHNLFLLGKRKPTRYLILQEDHNVSVNGLIFHFGAVGQIRKSAARSPQKDKISSLFLPKFN